jgi:glutamate racemase
LLDRSAKLIVIACNTATSAAVADLRSRYAVPFVSIEPALKPAAEATSTGTVALLVTPGTARGEKLASLIDRHGRGVEVRIIEAPGLAELVETGALESPETLSMVHELSNRVREAGADVVALGCTHYAFLREAFERELGARVAVLEPSEAVARQAVRVLDEEGLRTSASRGGSTEYLCSGDRRAFERVRDRVIGEEVGAR